MRIADKGHVIVHGESSFSYCFGLGAILGPAKSARSHSGESLVSQVEASPESEAC